MHPVGAVLARLAIVAATYALPQPFDIHVVSRDINDSSVSAGGEATAEEIVADAIFEFLPDTGQDDTQSSGGSSGDRGSDDGGGSVTVASSVTPSAPAGPPAITVCQVVGAINADCHSIPLDGLVPEGPILAPPEGQVPSFGPAPEAPAEPEPYVPSPAEIQATILAASDATTFPDFTLNTAPPGDLDAPLITQLATFLWVDDSQWQPVSAIATIPGYLTVTTTATPTSMWWSGGESGPIACYPPGIPWHPGAPEDCTMTYKTSSATNDHELRLTVEWDVSFTCSAYCTGGTLPSVTNEHVRPVRVAEIQSIVTSGG